MLKGFPYTSFHLYGNKLLFNSRPPFFHDNSKKKLSKIRLMKLRDISQCLSNRRFPDSHSSWNYLDHDTIITNNIFLSLCGVDTKVLTYLCAYSRYLKSFYIKEDSFALVICRLEGKLKKVRVFSLSPDFRYLNTLLL